MRLISSPRWRRRLLKGGVLAAVAGGIAFSMVHWSNTGRNLETPLRDEPAQVLPEPVKAPFARAKREGVLQTAQKFLRTAVVRERVADSWALTAPSLKQGYTKKTWATQDIPVQPYPVAAAKWKVDYSWRDTVGLKVALYPKYGSKVPAAVFDMQLHAFGKGKNRRWLVDSWTPTSYQQIPSGPLGATRAGPPVFVEGKLGAGWLAIPLSIFALGLGAVTAFAARGWLRDRRALRRYKASLL